MMLEGDINEDKSRPPNTRENVSEYRVANLSDIHPVRSWLCTFYRWTEDGFPPRLKLISERHCDEYLVCPFKLPEVVEIDLWIHPSLPDNLPSQEV